MNFFYEIFRKNKENLNTTFDIINYLLIVSLFILLIVDTIDFSTIMGFPRSANETMFSIIALLSEISILLTFILFGVLIALLIL